MLQLEDEPSSQDNYDQTTNTIILHGNDSEIKATGEYLVEDDDKNYFTFNQNKNEENEEDTGGEKEPLPEFMISEESI